MTNAATPPTTPPTIAPTSVHERQSYEGMLENATENSLVPPAFLWPDPEPAEGAPTALVDVRVTPDESVIVCVLRPLSTNTQYPVKAKLTHSSSTGRDRCWTEHYWRYSTRRPRCSPN